MAWLRVPAVVLALSLVCGQGGAQSIGDGLERGAVLSPVLTIDSQTLFAKSAFGQRIRAEFDAAARELEAENQQIYSDLEAEEKDLTERRATMTPEEFRPLADAFDRKVLEIRQSQENKSRALSQTYDARLKELEDAAIPVLERLMFDSGAAVILERRSVFLSVRVIDITEDAIERLDATLGDGSE